MKYTTDFGAELRKLRLNFGYTVRYIATAIGRSESAVRAMEAGQTRAPSANLLRKWLQALHMEEKFDTLNEQAKLNRIKFEIKIKPNDPANVHLVRLLDAYESGTLDPYDISLLTVLARVKAPYARQRQQEIL